MGRRCVCHCRKAGGRGRTGQGIFTAVRKTGRQVPGTVTAEPDGRPAGKDRGSHGCYLWLFTEKEIGVYGYTTILYTSAEIVSSGIENCKVQAPRILSSSTENVSYGDLR